MTENNGSIPKGRETVEAVKALTAGVPHATANLANAAALLYSGLERINWAGFYLLEGSTLVLGPFQGKPACIEIPLGRGVCGTAAREDRTLRVAEEEREGDRRDGYRQSSQRPFFGRRAGMAGGIRKSGERGNLT